MAMLMAIMAIRMAINGNNKGIIMAINGNENGHNGNDNGHNWQS